MFLEAIFQNGQFVPMTPLTVAIAEGTRITLRVYPKTVQDMTMPEVSRVIESCHTEDDYNSLDSILPESEGDYEAEMGLEAYRQPNDFPVPMEKAS